MADLEVIYDPQKELAAIVDVDNRVGWGPAMIGPHSGEILQAFIDSVPFDLSETDSLVARRHFDSFWSAPTWHRRRTRGRLISHRRSLAEIRSWLATPAPRPKPPPPAPPHRRPPRPIPTWAQLRARRIR